MVICHCWWKSPFTVPEVNFSQQRTIDGQRRRKNPDPYSIVCKDNWWPILHYNQLRIKWAFHTFLQPFPCASFPLREMIYSESSYLIFNTISRRILSINYEILTGLLSAIQHLQKSQNFFGWDFQYSDLRKLIRNVFLSNFRSSRTLKGSIVQHTYISHQFVRNNFA